jgi:hypothetical protein
MAAGQVMRFRDSSKQREPGSLHLRMPKLEWYFHRLMAMSPGEVLLRARKKVREKSDALRDRDWASIRLVANADFPELPARSELPVELSSVLLQDVEAILAGKWRAFGKVELQVDDPPRWHCDYLAGCDLFSTGDAFRLNHRTLPDGADVKLIWELSRWQQITRLAMAAYYLQDEKAGRKCIVWLEDWVKQNPPFKGWNWTSALETGFRLIQFVWIDALLSEVAVDWDFDAELDRLRYEILPPHVFYTWRHRSFGSSANNHLIGELTGLIAALVRWPNLAVWSTSLDELQGFWETEVQRQFASDGGNREQALNYHLFSFELCLIAWTAILAKGTVTTAAVEKQIVKAAEFFVSVQRERQRWDYGDSDEATVLPFWTRSEEAAWEWREWLANRNSSVALGMWWNRIRRNGQLPPRIDTADVGGLGPDHSETDWCVFSNSGLATKRTRDWFLRLDLSPLGYGPTAAHGHLDALHLTLWWRGEAIVIDPGTGAYYGDPELRAWLASRAAHNGPSLASLDHPKRLGAFLWSGHHSVPAWRQPESDSFAAEWFVPAGTIYRKLIELKDGSGWEVVDDFLPNDKEFDGEFTVRWQFAPGTKLERVEDRRFRLERDGVVIYIEASADWDTVLAAERTGDEASDDSANRFAGQVSPSFRMVKTAPFLLLTAQAGYKPCVFSTTFLASPAK